MLAKRRSFKVGDETLRTPLLIPSYSSRAGGEAVTEIINVTKEFVGGPVLVSAYDVKRHRLRQSALSFATHIFLDSGGYEAGADADLSEVVTRTEGRDPWTIKEYKDVLCNWDFVQPTIVVNYDSPARRETLEAQISRAKKHRELSPSAAHVFLAKPEPSNRRNRRYYVNVDKLVEHLQELEEFDILGITEKELGESLLQRLVNVSLLRRGLTSVGMEKPIHIFGSLDPVACPLFFVAGADIFDGLTWLRYGYFNGLTIYRQNVHATDVLDAKTRDGELSALIHVQNFHALGRLMDEMIRFTDTQNFEVFGEFAPYFEGVSERITAETGA